MSELKDSMEHHSNFDMVQDGIITEIVEDPPQPTIRSAYGKLIVLLNSRLCMISIGPDCKRTY
jgi:hypothetical protein